MTTVMGGNVEVRKMSRAVRLVGAVALACASVPLVGVGASHAELASETATTGAYFWSANPGTVEAPTPVGAQKPFPDQAKQTDGVAEDDLGVAVTSVGSADKWSALRWSLDALVPGSVVSKAVIVVPLSDTTGSTRTPNAAPGLVVACAVGDQGFADADAEPFLDAPKQLCNEFSAKARPVDGAYEFDITALAQTWVDSNDGVALYPSAAGLAEPFQQVFAPKAKARLTIAFTPGATEVLTPTLPEVPLDSGTATGTTDTGGASLDGGTLTPPSAGLDSGSAAVDPPVTAPQGEASPVVATAPQAMTPVAAVDAPMRFDAATWAALVGGAAVLVLASLSLGSPASAPAPASRAGGVGEQLARRQRAAAPRVRTL